MIIHEIFSVVSRFTATFHVILRKVDYLWDSVESNQFRPPCSRNVILPFLLPDSYSMASSLLTCAKPKHLNNYEYYKSTMNCNVRKLIKKSNFNNFVFKAY